MGKSTDPPKCKVCGEAHRGVCYQRAAKSIATIAHVDHRKTSLTAAITKVMVENPGKLLVLDESPELTPERFDAALGFAKRGKGRPKSITDLKAYKAEKAKAYRLKKKATPK